jgi:carboxyl-terminal processing protease
VKGEPARGEITTKQPLAIRSGAAEDASIVGSATKGASYSVLGRFNGWVKVKLNQGGSRVGFVPEASVAAGGSGSSTFSPYWHSTPPLISLQTKPGDTGATTYKLQGTVSDETHVEDVYIFVDNKTSKIENRKVFYRSNRGGKDGKTVDFAADLPLWPGSNLVTIVARENADVRSVKYLYLYRDPPRTASTRP